MLVTYPRAAEGGGGLGRVRNTQGGVGITGWTEHVSILQVSAEFLLSHLWGNLPALSGRERMVRGMPETAVSSKQSSSMMALKICCFFFFFNNFLSVQSSTFPLEDLRIFYLQNEMQNDPVSAGQTGAPLWRDAPGHGSPSPGRSLMGEAACLFSGAYLWRRKPHAAASVQR